MSIHHNFSLLKKEFIPELNTNAELFEHKKTKAKILNLQNDDTNKLFGITFPTIPENSSGTPHILEHTVLCASQKYKIKDPFAQLLKSSLNTFLNAFTYPDRTVYPFSTENHTDFYNLMDVYLNAVFFPTLDEQFFRQEGWRYEINDQEKLIFTGIVYNEMKGVFSNPDSILEYQLFKNIFPKTFYENESGGDPRKIPDLKYSDFIDFHKKFYHPSNSLTVLWGDSDSFKFKKLDEFFSQFSEKEFFEIPKIENPEFQNQIVNSFYDSSENKAFSLTGIILDDNRNLDLKLDFEVLCAILFSSSSSLLYKKIMDKNLGDEFMGFLEFDAKKYFLELGLKGISSEKLEKENDLIKKEFFSELEKIVDSKKITIDKIISNLNYTEFSYRDPENSRRPKQFQYFDSIMTGWFYGADPIESLKFEKNFKNLKNKIFSENQKLKSYEFQNKKNLNYFEYLIEKYILKNNQKITVNLFPDENFNKKIQEQERKKLDKIQKNMSESEIEKIKKESKELKIFQETPDSPEDLAKLPKIKVSDISTDPKHTNFQVSDTDFGRLIFTKMHTNDIEYIDLCFDISEILKPENENLISYLAIFLRYNEIGTKNWSPEKIDEEIGKFTGGLDLDLIFEKHRIEDEIVSKFLISTKFKKENRKQILQILSEITNPDFRKKETKSEIKKIILDEYSAMKSRILPKGHLFVLRSLNSSQNPEGKIKEKISGISYFEFLKNIIKNEKLELDEKLDEIISNLEKIKNIVFSKKEIILNLTSDEDDFCQEFSKNNKLFLGRPQGISNEQPQGITYLENKNNKLFLVPAQVNYVGKIFDFKNHEYHGSMQVVNTFLKSDYFWEKIRVQGGAYGGFMKIDSINKNISMMSYRDPNFKKTLEIYNQIDEFINEKIKNISQSEIEKSIIGTIGKIDDYQTSGEIGHDNLIRFLVGIDLEYRKEKRLEILNTTIQDFKSFSSLFSEIKKSNSKENNIIRSICNENLIDLTDQEKKKFDFQETKLF